ncbi:MAG: DUF2391 family protein [archaeon]
MKIKTDLVRIAGRLKEIVTVRDENGHVHKIINSSMVEFYPRDLMQVIIGATILAIPVAFTEETWNLGESLPLLNVFGLLILSLIFISSFVYYNFYRYDFKEHKDEFIKRVFSIYIASFLVVTVILALIQRAPWNTDFILAFKRTAIVSFPASMSAAISDMIK